jgi:hypothetical protein
MTQFADPNLQLIVLQAAWTENLLSGFDKEAFFQNVIGEPWDDQADYNYDPDERIRKALLSIELSDDVLAKVRRVEWDGGKIVFRHIWTYWDGGGDYFRVCDLSGIGVCRNLKELVFIGGAGFSSIDPVADLKELEVFRDHASLSGLKDIGPLLHLPKLRDVLVQVDRNSSNETVLAGLRARGAKVSAEYC